MKRLGPKRFLGLSLARILGLVLVPLTVTGLMLWGLWNPADRLQNVTAVIVNNDEPVTLDGQIVPLGRVLAAELVGETENNFNWVLSNDEEAEEGLGSGKYVAIVTIPENFSAGATSIADGPEKATQASIKVTTPPQSKLLDNALVETVTQVATHIVNQQLSTSFVDGVFVGMNELGEGLQQIEDGAEELADGQQQLADGMAELETGTKELAGGVHQLSSGAYGIAGGVHESAVGAREYAAGVHEFAGFLNQMADGSKVNSAGMKKFSAGVGDYVGGINSLVIPITEEIDKADEYIEVFEKYMADVIATIIDSEDLPEEAKAILLEQIAAGMSQMGELEQFIDMAGGQLGKLVAGGKELAKGAEDLSAGADTIAETLTKLGQGANSLAGGATELADGLGQLAGGADQLAAGTGQLSASMPELTDGAAQLAEGTRLSADGAEQLADGLGQVTAEIPSYTEKEREQLAKVAVEPVVKDGESSDLFSPTSAALFLATGLWAGGLALFIAVPVLNKRTRDTAGGDFFVTLKNSRPAILIGALQGILVGLLATLALNLNGGQTVSMMFLATIGGIVFALINQALTALFGGYGRFASLVALVVVFVAGVLSTVPALMGGIAAATPGGTLAAGAARVLSETGSIAGPLSILILWGIAGIVALLIAVRRERAAEY